MARFMWRGLVPKRSRTIWNRAIRFKWNTWLASPSRLPVSCRTCRLSLPLLVLLLPASVHAQAGGSWEAGGQFAFLNDAGQNDLGIGGRVGWHVSDAVALEGVVNAYLSHPEDVFRGGRKLQGLAGPTLTFRAGGLGLFGKARAGFARIGEGQSGRVCIAVFPPPESCFSADTRAAFDFGGGFDLRATPTVSLRVEAGDLITRGGRTADFAVADSFAHDLEIMVGMGVRF